MSASYGRLAKPSRMRTAKRKRKARGAATDPTRKRASGWKLRSRASLGRYLVAALRGRAADGAEGELQQAAGVDGIPLELWDVPRETREADGENRAVTPAPGTTGINLDTLQPSVFAPSVASRLGVEMPMVPSGTYATGTITTDATADAVAKAALVPETAAGVHRREHRAAPRGR